MYNLILRTNIESLAVSKENKNIDLWIFYSLPVLGVVEQGRFVQWITPGLC